MSQATRSTQKALWGRDKDGYRIQPTVGEIVEGIRLGGGELWLDDDNELSVRLPRENQKQWTELIKERRAGLIEYLLEQRPGKEITLIAPACTCSEYPFPHVHNPGYPRPWQLIPAPPAVGRENDSNLVGDTCYIHGTKARFGTRPDGSTCCAICQPGPEELWKQIQRTKTDKGNTDESPIPSQGL